VGSAERAGVIVGENVVPRDQKCRRLYLTSVALNLASVCLLPHAILLPTVVRLGGGEINHGAGQLL
jgi:hypothetical protein